jgi:hypothetical protein
MPMNPLLQKALGQIITWALTFLAGWFVQRGIWTQSASEEYIAGATLAILSLIWMVWTKYHDRLKFLIARDSNAGASEEKINAIANKAAFTVDGLKLAAQPKD